MKQLLYNAIKTPDGTILESKHRHDFVEYRDKNGQYYMVDGGLDYSRRGFDVPDYEDLSIEDDGTHETRRKYLKWGVNYDKDMNKLPKTKFTPIMDLNTDHIEAILNNGYVDGNKFYKGVFEKELEFRDNLNRLI